MKTVTIYLHDGERMVIHPTDKFDGNILDLVLHLTHSSFERHNYMKNYKTFEYIKE